VAKSLDGTVWDAAENEGIADEIADEIGFLNKVLHYWYK